MGDAHAENENDNAAAAFASVGRFASAHAGTLLWALGAVILLMTSILAHTEPQFPGDAAITTTLQRLHGTAIAPIVNFPSDINQPLPGAILAFAIIALFAAFRRVIEAIVMAVATFGADLINAIMNGLIARPRPHGAHVKTISGLGAHSFPSGHVEHVTMLFGFIFFLTLLARRTHPERRAWLLPLQIICVYFIALVGVGRIVEGAHQPSDVVAGYLIAALLLPLAIYLYHWLGQRWRRHKQREASARAVHTLQRT
ncbi:MAG: phosphatase PAP2 family protein [Nitrososphaerota archaeon]